MGTRHFYNEWIEGKPKATPMSSVESLVDRGYVGIYRPVASTQKEGE